MYQFVLRTAHLLSDLLIVNVSFLLGFEYTDHFFGPLAWTNDYSIALIASNSIWLVASLLLRHYVENPTYKVENTLRGTYKTALLHSSIYIIFLFFTESGVNHSFVALRLAFLLALFAVSSFTLTYFTEFLVKHIGRKKRIAIIGYNSTGKKLADFLCLQRKEYSFAGFFDDEFVKRDVHTNFSNLIGRVEACIHYVERNHFHEVYSTLLPQQHAAVERLVEVADKKCIRVKFVPDFSEHISDRYYISHVNEFPVITLRKEPLDDLNNRFRKRIFDIIFSTLVVILVLSWLTPLMALLIKLESRGPVFFVQQRSGRRNNIFTCLKFRSMKVNMQSDLLQATKHDSRITKIGSFMRKTSIDELPQFFNVLMGDMSICGPRPHMLKHTEEYSGIVNKFMVRHLLKPGITGWAQVSGCRGETETPEQMQKRVEHDLWYLENWSLMLDVKIVLMTIINMIRGEEKAY